ncbi:keratin-associated protein 10-1-like [Amphibalanus amphitrite]|uniref:keratin-associated protein 10-1-like n=1 Tax=Amphibalanus amphitrite TaxID=1232801 RepID=UPI001C9084D7|nr:keratin-associated protein 10-1-like [Amphibalanus amphitrite]
MKPFTVLVVALAVCSLVAAKETAAKEEAVKVEEGSSRQGRLFFLTKLLAGPAALECVATKVGYRCHFKSKEDLCPMLLEQMGCPENQYCGSGPDGNICKPKLQVGDTCTVKTQCLSDTCRNRKCKADACPAVDMSIDCMPTQYCSPGEDGNMCVAKKEKGAHCSSRLQCKSNVCDDRGVCIEDKCPHPYMEERCLPNQFCSPAPYGNVCVDKRNNNDQCHQNAECKSGLCRNGVCKANECPTPFSSEGCNQLTQICMITTNGKECLTKLPNQQPCLLSAQCLSGNCVRGTCTDGDGTEMPNGASCSMPTECASGNCVLQRCAATRNGISGVCMDNDDCQSNNCVLNVCAVPAVATTTDATTMTTTTASAAASLLDIGVACMDSADCASNNCVLEVCALALAAFDRGATYSDMSLCAKAARLDGQSSEPV